jgi:AcrR family transcriptional regulator
MIEAAMCEHAGSQSRQRILEAAIQVAIRDGILAITLDAVAREASMSKGGLIHHFRSKDDLISAMLEHFRIQTFRTLNERIAGDEDPRGRSFRAMVSMVLQPPGTESSKPTTASEMCRFFTALLAASANNPELLDSFRHSMDCMRAALISEGPNGLRQVALWPAIHGLLLWQHLGVISADEPVFALLIEELLGLAGGPQSADDLPGSVPALEAVA